MMKKRFLLSALTCGLLLGATGLQAKTATKTLMEHQIKKHTQETKKAPKKVIEGIQATFKSVHLIETGKLDEAKKLLEKANDDFEKALKADATLDLVPLEESLIVYNFVGTSKTIKEVLELSIKLIKDHDTQAAIALLSPLKDELDITVVAIPMKLYPASTKTALEALNKGDKKAALSALAVGFGTLVSSQIILPTPLLVAQDLIVEASKLDKSKKEEAKKLLNAAKEELNRAELLGYTKKHDAAYKLLNDGIDNIEKEIKGKNMVVKLYDKLKEDFKKIIHDTRMEKVKVKNPAEAKVQQYQKNETQKALKESEVFKKEAAEDEKKTLQ